MTSKINLHNRISPFTGVRGMISLPEQGLLITLAKGVTSKGTIVEIGSQHGMSASILVKWGCGDLYCIESNPDADFMANLAKVGLTKLTWFLGRSSDVVEDWNKTIGLLWIDGNHSAESVYQDLLLWGAYVSTNGIIALHDYPSNTNLKPHPVIYEGVKQGVDKWRKSEEGKEFTELYTVDSIIVFIRYKDRNHDL